MNQQARVFDTPHLARGAPWKTDAPILQRAKAQAQKMATQKGEAEASSADLPLPDDPNAREKLFRGWHKTHEGSST